MKSKIGRLIAAAAALVLAVGLASTASAQVSTSGTIEVIIQDQQGGRLPGVSVSASATDSVSNRTVVSDAQGIATLSQLAPSELYIVVASLSGFKEYKQERVRVSSGAVTTLHAQLVLSSVTEEVTVRGAAESPVVDVTQRDDRPGHHAAAHRVAADGPLVPELPAARAGRAARQPDAAGQPVVAVRHELEGRHHRRQPRRVDRQLLLLRRHQRDRPGDRHLRRQPEYRDHPGAEGHHRRHPGRVRRRGRAASRRSITKSGTNVFHGSGNYFFQNNNLVADNEHTPARRSARNDTAFTIGGPARARTRCGPSAATATLKRTRRRQRRRTRTCSSGQSKTIQKQGFAKGTWTPSANDLLSFTFLNDPVRARGLDRTRRSRTAAIASATRAGTTTPASTTGSGAGS